MIINRIDFKTYLFIMIFSILIGILYIILSLKNEKILNKKIILFLVLLFINSILFAKLFSFIDSNFKVNYFKASLASYGGLIGVIISALLYEKIYPNKGIIIKYSVISLPLIYSFGKIACFLRGCCYGIKYNGLFNVIYPHISNTSLFPIQLLEVIVFFILFLISNTLKNRKDITYITLLLISILKYLGEFLRYDYYPMNANQIFSIFLFSITIILYLKKYIIHHNRHHHF